MRLGERDGEREIETFRGRNIMTRRQAERQKSTERLKKRERE